MVRGLVIALACVGGLLLPADFASAQEAREEATYRAAVRRAVAAFDVGDWDAAQRAFEEAHALQPSARTYRGLGMAAFERGALMESFDLLTRALEDERRPLTDQQRADVAALLDRAGAGFGRFTLSVDPPDAEVRVDGVVRAEGPGEELRLSLGRHTVEARLDGYQTETREIEVRGGEQLEVALLLDVAPPASRAAIPVETIGYAIAAGGAFLIDLVFIGWAVDRQSAYDNCAGSPACVPGPLGGERDASAASAVFFGLSALGLGVTAFLYWLLTGAPTEAASSDCSARALDRCGARF